MKYHGLKGLLRRKRETLVSMALNNAAMRGEELTVDGLTKDELARLIVRQGERVGQ